MYTITATASGASSSISLPEGVWVLELNSAGAFVTKIQRKNGSGWSDIYYDATTVVTIDSSEGPQHVAILGGDLIRLFVTTYNSAITATAKKQA